MAIKQTAHIIRGLRRDFSDSKQPKEYAIDAKNIRITNREDSSLLSITNEKGTQEVTLKNNTISGNYLGHTTINDILVLFTRDTDTDYIYKINLSDNISIILFEGELSSESIDHIEALGIYESEDIQKVYWVDGVSQPRMININNESLRTDAKEFDFIQELQLNETISVEKSYSSGSFNSGVIQYAFNYYNKNGQETNIVDVTPINYISYEDRGAAPNDYVSNSFKITINNIDTNFDYLRLYSIHRTALDAQPSVKLLDDIKAVETFHKGEGSINFLCNADEYAVIKATNSNDEDWTIALSVYDDSTEEVWIKEAYKGYIQIQCRSGRTLQEFINHPDIQEFLKERNLSLYSEDNYEIRSSVSGSGWFELKVPKAYYALSYIDNGIYGETVDPAELLFKGGEWIIPKTIAQKDGTLFLGNIKTKNLDIPAASEVINSWREDNKVIWESDAIDNPTKLEGYYSYNNPIKNPNIARFKNNETYRLGIQFQHKSGKWSDPIFHSDSKVNIAPSYVIKDDTVTFMYNKGCLNIPVSIIRAYFNAGYKKVRPVIVFPSDIEKEVLAQGILCQTLTKASGRCKGSLESQSSWFFRPLRINNIEENLDITYGTYVEYRHGIALPPNTSRSCEVQSMTYSNTQDLSLDDYNSEYKNSDYYYVDSSILTFHSPEVELGNLKNTNNLKVRIVGNANITASIADVSIINKTSPVENISNPFYNYFKGILNINKEASKSALAGLLWTDDLVNWNWGNDIQKGKTMHMVYPWHREGSLNNGAKEHSLLEQKKLSNLKFSLFNNYFEKSSNIDLVTEDIQLFDNANYTSLRINTPQGTDINSGKNYFNYWGNVDDIISPFTENIEYKYTKVSDYDKNNTFNHNEGYPMIVGYPFAEDSSEELPLVDKIKNFIFPVAAINGPSGSTWDQITLYGKEPVPIKYKSSKHLVISLGISKEGKKIILPVLNNTTIQNSNSQYIDLSNRTFNGIEQKNINVDSNYDYFLIAEVYREMPNKFNGDNYTLNTWYPAGESKNINYSSADISVEFTQGDTFYSRFDSLKTYSDDLNAVNSVTEIGSFMVETRINLDARYDRNRGKQSNLVMNPGNFNLFNDVYNQKNNFFNYRIIDKDIADNTKFHNTIVWSKQKFAGADVDTWTNINMASSLDLDGTKGELTKLVSFKNEIFSFQPEAINHILFNSRVQIPTSDGVPIELSNAYKVDGARQLSSIGSSNPLAIKSADRGIYYMDNITKGIYVFNGQQSESLSDKLGMSSWVKEQNIDSYKVNYDKINQDIYFINNDNCLSYSEKLGEFESFFDYNDSEIFNVKDGTYAIKSNKLYKLFEGNYNRFFTSSKPFWITFTHNENPFNDKIYNTLEFRADTYNYITNDENGDDITPYWELSNDSSFDRIKVDNEYQDTKEVSLGFAKYIPSNLKRKFRIWRANIPRDFINKRDRIRNTWANITLKASNPSNTKTELHDLVVSYFM